MSRTLVIALALAFAVLVGGPVAASQLAASNPPIVLTPGTDQPITCQYALTGSLADPVCPAPTSTPVPTATPTPNTAIFTLVNVPAQGQNGIITCNNGTVSDLGPGTYQNGATTYTGVIAHCTQFTPTPTS